MVDTLPGFLTACTTQLQQLPHAHKGRRQISARSPGYMRQLCFNAVGVWVWMDGAKEKPNRANSMRRSLMRTRPASRHA